MADKIIFFWFWNIFVHRKIDFPFKSLILVIASGKKDIFFFWGEYILIF